MFNNPVECIKRILLIALLFILLQISIYGQTPVTLFTPKGSAVSAWITPEFWTDSARAFCDDALDSATRIYTNYFTTQPYSSTGRFNCHCYAWHMADAQTLGWEPRWIGLDATENANEDIYRTDSSYVQVCNEVYPGKISWGNAEHSAITTSTPGIWQSKWGFGPLVTHSKDDHIYDTVGSNPPYNYYVSTKITTNTTDSLCFAATRSFSVQNVSGVSYSWSYSSNLTATTATNTHSLTIQPNGTTPGAAWVQIQMSSACSATPVTRRINFTIGGTALPQPGSISVDDYNITLGRVTVSIDPNEIPGATYYKWYKNGVYQSNAYNLFWAKIHVPIEECDYTFTVGVTAVNSCGVESAMRTAEVYVPCDNFFLLSPNPAIQEVIVSAKKQNAANKNDNSTFNEVKIYDLYGNLKKQIKYSAVKQARISLAGLHKGVYFVEIVNGKFKERKQLLVQ